MIIKEHANRRKLRKTRFQETRLGLFASESWEDFPSLSWEHSPPPARRDTSQIEGVRVMLGKLAGAWLGEKIAGRNSGAKGAILGYGAAALARRSVPALAAVTLGGWAFRKWRDKRRAKASYPSEATPSS
jgi:hypothetical protein